MILNLNRHQGQKPVQGSLLASQQFLNKNKITVNEVSQAHYTVEGVQMYSAGEIKALKQTQERVRKLEGQIVQIKTYKLSEFLDDFEQQKTASKQEINKLLSKARPRSGNPSKIAKQKQTPDYNPKQSLMKNNNVLSQLQKQRDKKSAIEQKLSKLSKQYKQHFKADIENKKQQLGNEQQLNQQNQSNTSSLCQSLKKMAKSNRNSSENVSQDQSEGENFSKLTKTNKIGNKKNGFTKKYTNHIEVASTKVPTCKQKSTKSVSKKQKQNAPSSQQECSDVQFEDLQETGVNLVGKIFKNKSTYSEKLGSAVHLLFK